MRTLTKYIMLLLMLTNCDKRITLLEKENEESLVSVILSTDSSISKSSLTLNEDKIEEICIFGYKDGKLEQSTYLNSIEDIKLYLRKGISYNLYAVANCGNIEAPADERYVGNIVRSIPSITYLQGMIPFSWSKKGVVIRDDNETLTANMERLVSKISLSIDKSSLEGLQVKSARLRQSPLCIYPFMEGGSRILDDKSAADGDYASIADLRLLNRGESIFFYCFENCQGNLLAGNMNPWEKIPSRLADKASLCTYIEIECAFGQDALYEGTVKYRLYPGKDNCSNFDITRNHNINISLKLSENSMETISWKVDADVIPAVELIWEQSFKAEYLYQYGEINFPNATNSLPVKISFENSEILIGSKSAQKINSDGIDFYYIPTNPTTLYYYYKNENAANIKIQHGKRSDSYTIPTVGRHSYTIDLSKNFVNEDGYDNISGKITLNDAYGNPIPKRAFFYPTHIKSYYSYNQMDDINRITDLLTNKIIFYEDNTNKSMTNFIVKDISTQMDDSHILAKFNIYGLEAMGENKRETKFYCWDPITSNELIKSIEITPAFCDQKWLGEFKNMQVAPRGKKRRSLVLNIGGTGAAESTWEISRIPQGLLDTSLKPSASLIGPKNKYVNFKKESGTLTIEFKDPTPFAEGVQPNRADDFLPCGAMLLKGSVTNPHSNKTKVGYYTLDLVLYISIGVQVDIYPTGYLERPYGEVTGVSTSDLWWEFIPFNEFSHHSYSSFWKNSILNRIRVVSQYKEKKLTTAYPTEKFSDMPFKTTLLKYFPYDNLNMYKGEIASILNAFKAQYFSFEFQVRIGITSKYNELIVTRNEAKNYGDLSSYEDGCFGYYHIVRQYDIANYPITYGTENYVYDIAEDALEHL